MNSLILTAATRIITPLLLAFSIFILLRGHNAPGGGFIGGLLGAVALCLYAKAEGVDAARAALRVGPASMAMAGVGAALAAGFWGLLARGSYLAGVWPFLSTAADGSKAGLPVGSVILFDVGVYMVVLGGVGGLFFAFEDDAERVDPDDAAADDIDGGPR